MGEQKLILDKLIELNKHHEENCESYRLIKHAFHGEKQQINNMVDLPFIPVSLFKELNLKSIMEKDIYKCMKSSGTSGKQSKIYLDKETAKRQSEALSKLTQEVIGNKRLPMLILDSREAIKDRRNYSARAAGILGYSTFGKNILFALDKEMNIDKEAITKFYGENRGKKVLMYGFTYIIWKHIIQNKDINANWLEDELGEDSLLIHGGGWKKLETNKIGRSEYNNKIKQVLKVGNILNYYGMVEQTGSIFYSCHEGYFHESQYSRVIIRDKINLEVKENGKAGLVQLLSILPYSYPGHSILTEDIGIMEGNDGCRCGTQGKYFRILGRLKQTQARGCSDTYE